MANPRLGLERAVGRSELSRIAEGLAKAASLPVRVLDTEGNAIVTAGAPRPGVPSEEALALPDPHDGLRVPISREGMDFGALVIHTNGYGENGNGAKHFGDLALAIADILAGKCLNAMETRSLARELSNRYEELNLLYEVGRELTVARNASRGIQLILDKIREMLQAQYVVLTDPGARVRGFSAPRAGDRPSALPGDMRGMAAVSTRTVIAQGRALVVKDVCAPGPVSAFAMSRGSLLTVMVDVEEKSLGCISAFRPAPSPTYGSGDVKMLITLAAEMALVIKNAELFENLQSLFINVIRTLIFAIEGKDEYTRGHSERVNQFSKLIGQDTGMDEEQMQILNNSSLLHDIGKIYIPERILCKPDRLTPEEFDVIKTHPARGAQMLEPIAPLKDALSGVRHHHEKLDGSGYPDGIGGDDLPLIPRIVAIADIFDAMTSHRAYRPGMTIDQARSVMTEMTKRLIDRDLALSFLDKCERYYTQVQSEMNARGVVVQW